MSSWLALSSCWNQHRFDDGLPLAREVRAMGFDWMEVSYGAKVTLLPGLLTAVEKGIIRVCSLHAPCPSPIEIMGTNPDAYEFSSGRDEVRRRAVALTISTLEMAQRFGADRVVVHLGSVPMKCSTVFLEQLAKSGGLHGRSYVRHKLRMIAERNRRIGPYLERVHETLDQILPHAERLKVRLCVETRSHFEQIPTHREMVDLLSSYADNPWIGPWHDFGHVQRQANLGFHNHADYLAEIAPRLLGCHVHDVAWPDHDHRIPLSTKGVDFEQLLPWISDDVPMVWELSPRQKRLEIIAAREVWVARFQSKSLTN